MNQWEKWDQLMAEDEELRVRNARFEAATAKRKLVQQASAKPAVNHPSVVQLPLRPGEGRITGKAKERSTVIYYDQDDIAQVLDRTPWLFEELIEELERNRNEH
jgi:hypothetical protein